MPRAFKESTSWLFSGCSWNLLSFMARKVTVRARQSAVSAPSTIVTSGLPPVCQAAQLNFCGPARPDDQCSLPVRLGVWHNPGGCAAQNW